MGFFRTPNGSFWDQDDEYFNRAGYDVNGGYYIKEIEYIPGPNWLDDLGCYEKDKEKYMNFDMEKLDDENFFEEENEKLDEDIMKGDFEGEEDYFNDDDFKKFVKEGEYEDAIKGLGNLKINNDLTNIDILNSLNIGSEDINNVAPSKKKNKKKKKKNKKVEEDDEWKTSLD